MASIVSPKNEILSYTTVKTTKLMTTM